MNSSTLRARLTRSWPLLMLLLIATVWLYRSPFSASDLELPPDTVEYALAPLQLVETGRYEIMLEGRGLPPRYPPWFPALVIAPAYLLFGPEPGNAILPITLLAVIGIGFAYAIGRRISSNVGGVFAALALLFLPAYGRWAIQAMTDVPCTSLMLGACLLYLRVLAKPGSALTYLGAGALIAITTLFRPVYAAMLLPFSLLLFKQRERLLLRAIFLLAPMAVAVACTLLYNAATFGSPFRNGYNFWTAVPYDYPRMVSSLSYVPANLTVLGLLGVPILIVVCGSAIFFAWHYRPASFAGSRAALRDVLLFFILSTGPILLFHLFYFFPDDRFYLPVMAGPAILAGSIAALFVGSKMEASLKVLLPALAVAAFVARLVWWPPPVPVRRLAAEQVHRHTPENAIVISGMDPVYLGRLAGRGSARRIVPLSRNVEFAWPLLLRKRVDDPRIAMIKWPDIQPALDLLRPHAEQAVRFVASERVDELATEAGRGTQVFLESAFVIQRDVNVIKELRERFQLLERAPNLYQLQPR